ncbi:MAG: T9SS type A sorting domain-containing protein [Bacteroidales bacterium]|nr:T9SS type A sorting domain-containing protein [Bacteroidales bacterium]
MKTLKILLIQITACLIITGVSQGQGTFNLTDGIRVGISAGTSVQNNDLYIQEDSRLINRGELSVNGVLVNFAGTSGLVIKADENGYGSLLHDTPGVYATVEQYLSSERWHLVSSPVMESTIETYLDIYLKEWSEQAEAWNYLVQPVSLPMKRLQGFSAWASDGLTGPATVVFDGRLSNGNALYDSLTFTPGGEQEGYNLIGNPYPSPVEWNTDWYLQDIGGWAVVYENGTFLGWNPWMPEGQQSYNGKTNGMIAPTQGFWIKAFGPDPVIMAPQSARKHHSEPFYKEPMEAIQYIELECKANGYSDETKIIFMAGGTEGFDGMYELEKHWNIDEAPNIYTMENDRSLAIDVLPEDWIETASLPVIPLGLRIVPPTDCEIHATGIETFDPETPILLEDLKEGTIHNLRQNETYSFSSGPLDDPERFLLHFASPNDVDEIQPAGVNIYAYQNNVYVTIPSSSHGQAAVYDMRGIEICAFDLDWELTKKSIDQTGYYVVQVIMDKTISTQKVFIKNR